MSRQAALLLALLVALGCLLALLPTPARAACVQVGPDHPDVRAGWNPTGWRGCEHYGVGYATRWPGPGVAVNDCTYPWTDCTPIRITVVATGASLVVSPTMFCDCWHGTARQVLVDLDPAAVAALGLDWDQGKYRVVVEPAVGSLPDTAVPRD